MNTTSLCKRALFNIQERVTLQLLEISRRPPILYSSTVLSSETRFQQNPFLRSISDILQEFQVVRANLTTMNEATSTIADCLQFKIFKVKKLLRDIVFKTTGFLNLWPYTCLFVFIALYVASYENIKYKNILPAKGSAPQCSFL